MHRLLLVLALALALAAAAPAGAATTTIGSDLKGDASFAIANPNDWSVWNAQLVTGGPATVPVDGELNAVSIKGIALQNSAGTPFVVHIQVLHPGSTGGVSITVTSEALAFPSSGDPQQITRFGRDALDLSNTRMCVKKGDFVAFSTNGGAEVTPPGVALQVFKRNPGSAMQVFKTSDGHYPGSFSGTTQESQELLMQAEIGTGANARPFCGGTEGSGGGGGGGGATPTPTATPGGGGGPGPTPTPTATPPASGPPTLTVEQQGKPKVRHHKFSVKLACSASATCTGTLAILRGTKTLASKTVSVDPRTAKLVKIKLNASGYALFKQKGSTLNVTAKVTAGGLVDKRDIRIVKPGLT